MPHNRSVRRARLTSDYIKTTKGGTRYVRAIDVLRSEGGRKAIGAILEESTEPETPSTKSTATSNGTGTTNRHAKTTTAEMSEDSETVEEPVARASSTYR